MTFEKYKKIYVIGREENEDIFKDPNDKIIIEEKVDGANFRFMVKEGRIIFGSRNQSIGDDTTEIGGNWKRCVTYIIERLPQLRHNSVLEYYLFYGECMVKHTMPYDWEKIPPYLGIDILDFRTNKFLDYEKKVALFTELGFTVVPLIATIKAGDIKEINDSIVPKSFYPSPSATPNMQIAEGIVFKNYDKQIFAKFVRERFKEKSREVFGMGKKFAENDDERIVATYCTNARIEKVIFKTIADGDKLEMKLMAKVPSQLIQDIFEENWKEICMSHWSVSFKGIRRKINKRCLAVISQMITNSALQK